MGEEANRDAPQEAVAQVTIPQGRDVLLWGILGVLLACMPTLMLLPFLS
jgi:hypothetical protein